MCGEQEELPFICFTVVKASLPLFLVFVPLSSRQNPIHFVLTGRALITRRVISDLHSGYTTPLRHTAHKISTKCNSISSNCEENLSKLAFFASDFELLLKEYS